MFNGGLLGTIVAHCTTKVGGLIFGIRLHIIEPGHRVAIDHDPVALVKECRICGMEGSTP